MPDQAEAQIRLLRAAYAAFNARDFNAAFATMSADVVWPRAFKGGVARGHDEIQSYWTEQWSEIRPHVEPVSFHPEVDGQIRVNVQQIVHDLNGVLLVDALVGHRFTIKSGLIQSMEVCPPLAADRRDQVD